MKADESLKENIIHGTTKMPIKGMQCTAGEGTPYPFSIFVDRHWHHKTEIVFIRKGTYEFEINLETYILKEGDICFINSEDLHKMAGKAKTTIHDVLLFDSKILNFTYEDDFEENVIAPFVAKEKRFPPVITPQNSNYQRISTIIQKLMIQSIEQNNGWYCSCKLLLLELLNIMEEQHLLLSSNKLLSATDKQKISRYKDITSYIEKNYAEPITLQQLADIIPCNSQYLCRFFKEITGITPIQYLIQKRVEYACEMLKETTKSILEISLDCGFDNVSYFIRQFKKLKGCTPKEYRRKE